jgi:uncharacterized membrane protein YphA (DoxX/SURF4 family)|tara:strand:+ start:9422 stop:10501 length:1080 start_codon:yes stop_codon:yes gene_type:complete
MEDPQIKLLEAMKRHHSRISLLALLILFVLPASAHAHMRWFVDGAHPEQNWPWDLTSYLVLAGGVLFFLVSLWIHRAAVRGRIWKKLEEAKPDWEPWLWRLVAFLTGLALIMNSAGKDYLAPNLSLPDGGVLWFGLIAQLLVGILLITQVSFSISGVLIYVAAALAFLFNPIDLMVDYMFEFTALGLSLILVGSGLSSVDKATMDRFKFNVSPFSHLALPILRVGVGLTLVALAIHNKLLNPSMAVGFLNEHDLNFMPYIGFSEFSHLHYAFSAGIAELVIGILILFGIATRWTVAVLSIFFFSTLIALGPAELVGHFPLLGIAVLLIVCGGGRLRGRIPGTVSAGSAEDAPVDSSAPA